LKIPLFGALYKKIKITQYRLHLTWKREKEEEMRFQKRQAYNKKTTPKFLPVIPLLPTKLSLDELKDKAAYILFTLQVSKGLTPGTLTYRKSIRTFEEGDPQQWMEVITGLKEIWAQNLITVLTDMPNTAVAILKGDSLTSYEAAMEDNRTNPDDKSLMVPMTEQHIDDALLAVTKQIFPYCALKTQKQWMSQYARKPYKMGAKQFVILMSQINNYIWFFPNATVLSKYSEEELLGILKFAVPPHWRKAFDLRDYLPTSDSKARFISECERVERNKAPPAKERDGSDNDHRSNKKTKFAKSEKSALKSGQKKDTESGPKYCTHCKTDTHNTELCWKSKKIAREKELSEKKAPYSKWTFRKEVNAIACRAGKNGNIKIVKKAIKCKQGKHGKKEKKHAKVACAKKAESSDSASCDESINVMEPGQSIPCKKRYAQRTIQFDARGNQVDIKDSDSVDDRRMPAKISCKKPKKVTDPMDTESSEETDEDEDFKASKEEKAFLRSIDKKENSGTDSD
jgi:hypothetical protein